MDALFRWSLPCGRQFSPPRRSVTARASPPTLSTWIKVGAAEERDDFYFTSQGSQLVPYEWFLALEQPENDRPFREVRTWSNSDSSCRRGAREIPTACRSVSSATIIQNSCSTSRAHFWAKTRTWKIIRGTIVGWA